MKVQVLVTTMHQSDFSKYYDMNLSTDAVIANQYDCNCEQTKIIDSHNVKLKTTNTRGLSKNRNIAMENISDDADFIVFADDDLRFYDNYEQIILSAFEKNPQADAIKFNLNCISKRKLSMGTIKNFHKVKRREVASWGVCALAIKVVALKQNKLRFNERFGTGTENYCGEDSIFLQQLFKQGIAIFASPDYIAEIDQSESSWFSGYDERYFIVSGMVLSEIYPILCYPLIIRSAYKFSKRKACNLPFLKILTLYYKGVKKNESEHKFLR